MYLSQQNIREFILEDSHQRTPKICASDRRLNVWGEHKGQRGTMGRPWGTSVSDTAKDS